MLRHADWSNIYLEFFPGGIMYTMVVSYLPRKSLVVERIVSYDFYYLFPAGFICINVSLQTPALLFPILHAAGTKFITLELPTLINLRYSRKAGHMVEL